MMKFKAISIEQLSTVSGGTNWEKVGKAGALGAKTGGAKGLANGEKLGSHIKNENLKALSGPIGQRIGSWGGFWGGVGRSMFSTIKE